MKSGQADALAAAESAAEGERYAAAYIDRLGAGQANPEQLAVLVEYLRGEMLRAFCAVIHRALLEVRGLGRSDSRGGSSDA